MGSKHMHSRGFTLLEVLMASAMLAVAALGLGASLLSASNLQTNSEDRSYVLGLARAQLDYARTAPLPEVLLHLTGSSSKTQLEGGGIVEGFWAAPGLRGTSDVVAWDTSPGKIYLQRVSTETGSVGALLVAIKVHCEWIGSGGQPCHVLVTGHRRL